MSIEVYIDNLEVKLERKDFKTLGAIILEINEILEKDKKIANNIYVNGEIFNEKHSYNGVNCVIEVTTISQEKIFFEGLYNIKKYSERYFLLLEETYEYNETDIEFNEILKELIWVVNWFLNLMVSLREEVRIDFEIPEIDELIEEMKREHLAMKESVKMGDTDCLLDILEYEMSEVINKILENQNLYIDKFIEDIERRKSIN